MPSGQGLRSTQARPRGVVDGPWLTKEESAIGVFALRSASCCSQRKTGCGSPIPQGSPVHPGLNRHSPGRPGLAWAAAPHTSGLRLQSRGFPARTASRRWSSKFANHRRWHRNYVSRNGPQCHRTAWTGTFSSGVPRYNGWSEHGGAVAATGPAATYFDRGMILDWVKC